MSLWFDADLQRLLRHDSRKRIVDARQREDFRIVGLLDAGEVVPLHINPIMEELRGVDA